MTYGRTDEDTRIRTIRLAQALDDERCFERFDLQPA